MTPEAARNLHLAVKLHFTQNNYDLLRFRGKVNTASLKEPSKLYKSLASKYPIDKELRGLFVAACVAGFAYKYVDWYLTDDAKQVWLNWLRRTEGLSELIRSESEIIVRFRASEGLSLRQMLEPVDNSRSFPPLLDLYLEAKISPETVIVYLTVFNYFARWDRKISDQYVWPSVSLLFRKYAILLQIDLNKMAAIIKETNAKRSPTPNQTPKLPKRSDPNVLSDCEWDNLIASIT